MSRTRADLLASYRGYLALQRDLSGHTVRAYLVDINDLLSFLGVGEGDAEPVDAALAKAAGIEAGEERQDAIMAAEELILATGAAVPLLHERVLQGEAAGLAGAERDPRERALITSATVVA